MYIVFVLWALAAIVNTTVSILSLTAESEDPACTLCFIMSTAMAIASIYLAINSL